MSEQKIDCTTEVETPQSMGAKQTEIEQLRAEVQSLQDIQKKLKEQNDNLTTDVVQFQSVYAKKQAEVEQLRATVYQLEYQVEVTQQSQTAKHELLQKVHELECLTERLQARNLNLLDELGDLQESKNSLNQQQKNISAELKEVQSQTEIKKALNEKLMEEIHALEEKEKIVTEKNQSLSAEVNQLEGLTEEKHRQNISLKEEIFLLKFQLKEAQKENKKFTDMELLNEKCHAEQEKFRKALHELREKEAFMDEQNNRLAKELAKVESQKNNQNEDIVNLKTALQDLEHKVAEAQQVICNQEELITEQNNLILHKQELIDELYEVQNSLKQTSHDLRAQLEAQQEEDVLTSVQNFREESRIVLENTEKVNTPLVVTPAAAVQPNFWRRYSKVALYVAWHVGINFGGLGLSSVAAGFVTSLCRCIHPMLDLHYLNPPPF